MVRIVISFPREEALSAIGGVAEYHEMFERQLHSAKDADRDRISEAILDMALEPDEELAEWDLAMQQHRTTFEMFLPNYLRYSLVTLLHSVAEHQLGKLCPVAARVRGIAVATPRPRAGAIRQYEKFLSEDLAIAGLDFGPLHELNSVRNCIVHALGRVGDSERDKFLRQLAKTREGLSISDAERPPDSDMMPLFDEDQTLMIGSEYCRYAIGATKVFFEELCDSIPLSRFRVIRDP